MSNANYFGSLPLPSPNSCACAPCMLIAYTNSEYTCTIVGERLENLELDKGSRQSPWRKGDREKVFDAPVRKRKVVSGLGNERSSMP